MQLLVLSRHQFFVWCFHLRGLALSWWLYSNGTGKDCHRYHWVFFFSAKWSEDVDTSSCCSYHLALLCFECSCGTTRTGITQIQPNCVAKITYLIDGLRYMIEVGWNPHNLPMEKQLHGRRRLTLKGEPGRIALHGFMYWRSSVQGADKWSVNIFVAPKHWRSVAITRSVFFVKECSLPTSAGDRQPWSAL